MSELSAVELERRWHERVRSGQFSPAVLGVGTIRVMGRSGDAPVAFPRIASLAALPELELDEQYAVRAAQAIVEQARGQSRQVFAVAPAPAGSPAGMGAAGLRPVSVYEPDSESLIVVARIAGG